MTPEQKTLVQASFQQVAPVADEVSNLFYTRLFETDPSLRALFRGDLQEQGRKLMQMIEKAVHGLDDLPALVPVFQALGRRHAGYGVRAEHYDTVAGALIWTLEQKLGADFTNEVRDAWVAVYMLLATTMKAAAARPTSGTNWPVPDREALLTGAG
jgi:hemoglobin-like flavoprotein